MKFFALAVALFLPALASLRADNLPGVKEPLKTVTAQYLIIQKQLAADSFDAVAAAAATMKAATTMKIPAGTPTSQPFAPDFLSAIDVLAEAKDLHSAREAFFDVSSCLIAALALNQVQTGVLQTAFCPMRKAYWVQTDGKTIKNPYYGAAMLDCGEFQKQF